MEEALEAQIADLTQPLPGVDLEDHHRESPGKKMEEEKGNIDF